ncbi:MAG: gamma-glutamyl-gamma-aminobutyrate hydrolase family protein [Shimia sp.]
MTPPPRIAISQRSDLSPPPSSERRDGADRRLMSFVTALGCLPFPVPNVLSHDLLDAWLTTLDPAGIVLSGGNDIGTDPPRDATESALIAWTRARGRPLLGICRGLQMLCHEGGVALEAVSGHVATRHALSPPIREGVNSFHAMAPVDVPPGWTVRARAAGDGMIEAMAHETLPWEAWMWHPERDDPYDPEDVECAKRLLNPPKG